MKETLAPGTRRSSEAKEAGGRGAASVCEELLEVTCKVPSRVEPWISELAGQLGVRVRIRDCRPAGPGKVLRLVTLTAPAARIPEVETFVRSNAVADRLALSRYGRDQILVYLLSDIPPLCRQILGMGAVCTNCASDEDPNPGADRVLSFVVAKSETVQRTLYDWAKRLPGSPQILRIAPPRGTPSITLRQQLAVELALKQGYYADHHRVGLREISPALGVSPSTAGELLRSGVAKILQRETQELPLIKSRLRT